jgi:hypothetical protein
MHGHMKLKVGIHFEHHTKGTHCAQEVEIFNFSDNGIKSYHWGFVFLRKSIKFCKRLRAPILKPTLPLLEVLVKKVCHYFYSVYFYVFLFTEFPVFVFYDSTALSGPGLPNYRGFAITLRHTIIIRTPLDE